jgi:hypothetical protein
MAGRAIDRAVCSRAGLRNSFSFCTLCMSLSLLWWGYHASDTEDLDSQFEPRDPHPDKNSLPDTTSSWPLVIYQIP